MATTYYIFKSGRIKRKRNTVYLESESDDKVEHIPIPVENIRDLYIFGEVDFNTKLMSFFFGRKELQSIFLITTAFMRALFIRVSPTLVVFCWLNRWSII